MKFKTLLLMLSLLALGSAAEAQGRIIGKITDKQSNAGIEYASVVLLRTSDSSLVAGAASESNGSFSIKSVPFGTYLLRVTFMGYGTYFHATPVTLSSQQPQLNVGRIALSPTAAMLEAAEITAERSMVEYQLDKRVINIDKNIVAGGGTATDVLEQVPSVAIDNDGNVTLRGSTNVKVLIDGRPYELMGSDLETLLEQIPASTVENVEVITNPSAKYDPEGMSGIINIKLKEKASGALGLNGMANVNLGAPLPFLIPDDMPKFIPTEMGTLNLNYTTERYSLFLNLDGGHRSRAGRGVTDIERRRGGTPYSHDSLYTSNLHPNLMGSIKVGGEYYFKDRSSLLLSYQLRGGNRQRWSHVRAVDLFYADSLDYDQYDTNDNRNLNHTVNLSYVKKFSKPDQQLTFDATFGHRDGNGDGRQEQRYYGSSLWDNYYFRETSTDNKSNNLNLQLNYVHPFGEGWRLETGYEGRMSWSNQNYLYYMTTYDAGRTLHKELDDISSTHYIYNQQVQAIYATVGGKLADRLSMQAGLRGEYSHVSGHDENHPAAQEVDKPYWKLYPTLHLSYELTKMQSFQLSYSRRVRRPWMWDLNPYLNVREGQQLSFGNPGLDPEFTNSVELSYNLGLEKTNIFTSLYFRQTNNMMTRYGYVWDSASVAHYSPWMTYNSEYDGYWASTWQNLNRGINAGLEFIVDRQMAKWWRINVSINLYKSYIEGTELLDNQSRNAFRAGGKINSFMTLPNDWTVQFSGQYNAPFMDLQTDMRASYWCDLAVKKDLWAHRATVSLRVGDIFCTGGWGHTTDNEQLYRVSNDRRISPTVTLGFSYKINNGLRNRNMQPEESYDEGDSDY